MVCKWCMTLQLDGDCLQCESERQKQLKKATLATFNTDDPADMELARKTIGRKALDKAFGESGGGIGEIIQNLKDAGKYNAND